MFVRTIATLSLVCAASGVIEEQCSGLAPMLSVSSYLGMALDYSIASSICCNNHHYAEASGYFQQEGIELFSKLDPGNVTTFYDSVCGLPLFRAPVGRTFAAFREESEHHGWPSFRTEEMISENVIIHEFGRMESICGTHLGHNLPTKGSDRFCIDLVCMAGTPKGEGVWEAEKEAAGGAGATHKPTTAPEEEGSDGGGSGGSALPSDDDDLQESSSTADDNTTATADNTTAPADEQDSEDAGGSGGGSGASALSPDDDDDDDDAGSDDGAASKIPAVSSGHHAGVAGRLVALAGSGGIALLLI